jgi:hypothetical protein
VRYCIASAKTIKDVAHEYEGMESSDNSVVNSYYQEFRKDVINFYTILEELLERKNTSINLPRLVKLMQGMQENDKNFIKGLSELISKKVISDQDISMLLSANRSFKPISTSAYLGS